MYQCSHLYLINLFSVSLYFTFYLCLSSLKSQKIFSSPFNSISHLSQLFNISFCRTFLTFPLLFSPLSRSPPPPPLTLPPSSLFYQTASPLPPITSPPDLIPLTFPIQTGNAMPSGPLSAPILTSVSPPSGGCCTVMWLWWQITIDLKTRVMYDGDRQRTVLVWVWVFTLIAWTHCEIQIQRYTTIGLV